MRRRLRFSGGLDTWFRLDMAAEDTAEPAQPAETPSEPDTASAIGRSEMDHSSPGTNLVSAADSPPGPDTRGALESSSATDPARALESNPVLEEPAAATGASAGRLED